MEIRAAVTEADWAAVQFVRRAVFVVEQNVPDADEWDAWDAAEARGRTVHHLLAIQDGMPVGAARWRAVPTLGASADRVTTVGQADTPTATAKLERFAVVPHARGTGLGRRLVARALTDARAAGHRRFVLHAQTYVTGLYRSFGFEPEGDPFIEDGLEHVKMTLAD